MNRALTDIQNWIDEFPERRTAQINVYPSSFWVCLKDVKAAEDGCGNSYAGIKTATTLDAATSGAIESATKRLMRIDRQD